MKTRTNETLLLLVGLAGFATVIAHSVSQSVDNTMTEDQLRQERRQAMCGNCSGWQSDKEGSPSFLTRLVNGEKTEQDLKDDRDRLAQEMAACAILDKRTGKPIDSGFKEYLVQHNPPRPHFHGVGDCVVMWDSQAKHYDEAPAPAASASVVLPPPVDELAPPTPAPAQAVPVPPAPVPPAAAPTPHHAQPSLSARDRQLLKDSNRALDAALKGL